ALELGDRADQVRLGRLGQHANPDEGLRIELDHPRDQVVAAAGPLQANGLVSDVGRHGGGAWREDRQVGAALAQQTQLVLLDGLADVFIRDVGIGGRRFTGLEGGDLGFAPSGVGLRRGRIVTVAVDDEGHLACALPCRTKAILLSSPSGGVLRPRAPMRAWPAAAPRLMSDPTPRSSRVRTTSSISAERRVPWIIMRSRL